MNMNGLFTVRFNPPFLLMSTACLLLSACSTTTPVSRPELHLPAQWSQPVPPRAQVPDGEWWPSFGSTQLSRLVQEALSGSPDLKVAAERIRQARAQLGTADAARYPTVGVGLSTSTRRADPGPGAPGNTSDSSSASLSISYEVDLWGRVAAGIEGSKASLRASELDAETARLTLITGVASTYFQTLSLASRLDTARRNLEIAERVLRVVQAKNKYGVATSLDVTRQQTTVLTQRTALVPLEVQLQQQRSALAVLLGRVPQGFPLEAESFAALRVPEVSPGLPSDLLDRRPDLARAEADLRGANANVQVARAAFFPSFSLSGSGGLGTATLLSLSNPSTSLGLGTSLAYTLFDAGRRDASITIADSQRQIVVENYRKAILTALKEVDDALGNVDRYRREEVNQREIVRQSRQTLSLAELRYREGADDLLTVLDAQRTLFQAEDQLSLATLSRLTSALDVYKVLGGGWRAGSPMR